MAAVRAVARTRPAAFVTACALGLAVGALPALADETHDAVAAERKQDVAGDPVVEVAADQQPSAPQRVCPTAVAASVIPGLLVHGAGHYVAGERRTARRLLLVEGVGLGTAATGGLALGLSGASRWLSGPAIGLAAIGIGTFGLTWLADVYGAAGGARRGARPRLSLPPLAVHAGYAYVRDPEFDYASFAVAGGEVVWRAWRASLDAWLALGDDNQRVRSEWARRLLGAGARRGAADGSYLEVGAAASEHRYASDAFAVDAGEIFGVGRVDLARVGPSLDGSFVELLGGLQLEHIRYGGVSEGDLDTQLLVRAGFGLYFGRPGAGHGELKLYYDHRRDGFVGGLAVSQGGGFLGHFGIAGFYRLARGWGLTGALEAGAADVVHVGLLRQFGEVER